MSFHSIRRQKSIIAASKPAIAAVVVAGSLVVIAPQFAHAQAVVGTINAIITEGQPIPGDALNRVVTAINPSQNNVSQGSPGVPQTNGVGGLILTISTGSQDNGNNAVITDPVWYLWGKTSTASPLGIFRSASDPTPDGAGVRGYSSVSAGIDDAGRLGYVGRTSNISVTGSPVPVVSVLVRHNGTSPQVFITSGSAVNAPTGVSPFSQWGSTVSRTLNNGNTLFYSTYATTGTTSNATGLFLTNGTAPTPLLISGQAVTNSLGSLTVANNDSAVSSTFKASNNGLNYIVGVTTTGVGTAALVINGAVPNVAGTPLIQGQAIPGSPGQTFGGLSGPSVNISENGNWIAQIDAAASPQPAQPRLLVVNGSIVARFATSPLALDINDNGDYAYILAPSGVERLFINGIQALSNGDQVFPLNSATSTGVNLSNIAGTGPGSFEIGNRDANGSVQVTLFGRTGSSTDSIYQFTYSIPEPATLAAGLFAASLVLRRRK